MRLIDLVGKKYHMVKVVKRVENNKHNQVQYLCICDCGKRWIVLGKCLSQGKTKSCGCWKARGYHKYTHNKSKTKIYKIWASMKARCENKNDKAYKNYGGRGIKVCKKWHKFENFYFDMGERPLDKSLDRINNDGNYFFKNCRWATRKEQNNNRRLNWGNKFNGSNHIASSN